MNNKIIIYGASGHGKVVAEVAELSGYKEIVFFDDDISKKKNGKYNVIHSFPDDEYDLVVAIGDNATREKISKSISRKQVSLIHPNAVVSSDVVIGDGVVVLANAVIGAGTRIGSGVIINTCASVDHDNYIDEYVHVSVNAHTAGTVQIGKRTFLGINSAIINNVSITDDVVVGAGAIVTNDIEESGVYIGIPAKKTK